MSAASSRDKILAAATEVARELGAANLSLDAVAAKAGVSKGGLLYHFPNKAALMRATVETFVTDFEQRLDETAQHTGGILAAFVDQTIRDCSQPKQGAAGVMAAMAEDPNFLDPVRAFQRRFVDRLMQQPGDHGHALLVYLAAEGLRAMHLFETDIFTDEELKLALGAMQAPAP